MSPRQHKQLAAIAFGVVALIVIVWLSFVFMSDGEVIEVEPVPVPVETSSDE